MGLPKVILWVTFDLLACIETVLRYHHPDWNIDQCEISNWMEDQNSLCSEEALENTLTETIGIDFDHKWEQKIEHLLLHLNYNIPPIVSLVFSTNNPIDHRALVVGFDKKRRVLLFHPNPEWKIDQGTKLTYDYAYWAIDQKIFEKFWQRDILAIYDNPSQDCTNLFTEYSEHIRDAHHNRVMKEVRVPHLEIEL
ncbi:MAG: hypothetical protein KAS16_02175 [Thermoplasmata archaeon]|nr:hypothetical protein [Thermoplasmata archaeon]